jgi:hypothetical protein
MFHGMSHARHFSFVTEVADGDIKSSTRFVGLWIMDKKSFELVGKLNHAIVPIIERRLLETIREKCSR